MMCAYKQYSRQMLAASWGQPEAYYHPIICLDFKHIFVTT